MFGIIADAHIRGKDWEDKKKVLDQLKGSLEERGVQVLFNAGDLADNYGKWNDKYVTTNSVVAHLNDWLSSQNITLISIEGNHDQSGQESAYDVFQHPQQIVVKNEVKWIGVGDHAFICVPWLTNNRVGGMDARLYAKEMIKACFEDLHHRQYKTINIVGHLDAVGAKIRDHVSITSEEYSKYCFDFMELDRELPGRLDNIFLGHIHSRQPIKARGEGYYGYVGYVAPLGHGEQDNYEKFGWTYFDGEKVEFVQLDAPKYYSFQAKELDLYADIIRPWDRIRIVGSPGRTVLCDNVELVGEKLEIETVRDYIDNKNHSLIDTFKKWVEITEIEVKDDALIMDYLEQVNIKWDSLTGKLTKLLSVEIEDVGPHHYFKHEFKDGFTVILGDNGQGKSFILESFPFTVFGNWPTKRGSSASYMGPKSKLTVKFEIEGTIYIAVRTLKGLTVYDGEMRDLTGKLKRSSKEFLEGLLGEETNMLQCCFSDQKSNNGLIDCDPSSRMQMLRSFLKLDIFDSYHEDIKQELSGYKLELSKLQSIIATKEGLEFNINVLKGKVEGLESVIAEVNEKQVALSTSIDKYSDNYELEQSFLFKKKTLEDLNRQLESVKTKVRQCSLEHLKDQFPMAHDTKDKLNKELRNLKDQRKVLYTLKDRKAALRLTLNGSQLGAVGCSPNFLPCPLINKLVDAKAELEKIDDVDSSINALSADISDLERKLTDDEKSVLHAKAVSARLAEYNRDATGLQRRVDSLTKEITSLDYNPLTVNFKQLKQEYDEANKRELQLAREHESALSQLKLSHKKLQELLDLEGSKIPQLVYQVESYTVLEKAFSKYGIPHYLASSALPELQEIFNNIIKVGFEDKLTILFDNISEPSKKMKENFSIIKVNARNAHDVRYCSPGEQSVLQTLWKLTLLTFQTRRNEGYRVLFLDEPTHWQDSANVEASMRVLRYVAGFFDQIIMVTHDEALAELADQKVVLGGS